MSIGVAHFSFYVEISICEKSISEKNEHILCALGLDERELQMS